MGFPNSFLEFCAVWPILGLAFVVILGIGEKIINSILDWKDK